MYISHISYFIWFVEYYKYYESYILDSRFSIFVMEIFYFARYTSGGVRMGDLFARYQSHWQTLRDLEETCAPQGWTISDTWYALSNDSKWQRQLVIRTSGRRDIAKQIITRKSRVFVQLQIFHCGRGVNDRRFS